MKAKVLVFKNALIVRSLSILEFCLSAEKSTEACVRNKRGSHHMVRRRKIVSAWTPVISRPTVLKLLSVGGVGSSDCGHEFHAQQYVVGGGVHYSKK